jgi:chloramphenicol 3-O phosphotransferase
MTGRIIFINGTSSSGKTSIVRALQGLLEEPYLDMGLDKFIFMLPKRYLNRPLWDEVLGKAFEAGPAGRTLISGMHHAIAAAAGAGNNVLADHVLVEKDWADECARLFWDMPAYLIGLRCPLDVLEQREASRQDRTLGQGRAQYEVVHKYAAYDLEVDTSALTPDECAHKIIERIKSPAEAFRAMKSK